jgi:hypothetical protein
MGEWGISCKPTLSLGGGAKDFMIEIWKPWEKLLGEVVRQEYCLPIIGTGIGGIFFGSPSYGHPCIIPKTISEIIILF